MAEMISAFQAAVGGLSAVVSSIERIAAYRAEKKRQKAIRRQGQFGFLHDFSFAGAPDEDATEDETIRSYCKKLQNIIRSHWGFIFGRGSYNAEAAHAFMASTLFHVAAMPGMPPPTKPAMTDGLTRTYQRATTKLSDVLRLLENACDYKISGLSLTIDSVDQEVETGFAMSANLQATYDVARMLGGANYYVPPILDDQTSQTNVADLLASQSSPDELSAAYARVEARCVQSISRNNSPCNSQYSSECNSPVSPTFSEPMFGSKTALVQQDYCQVNSEFMGCGDNLDDTTRDGNGSWGWSYYMNSYSDSYHPTIGRSASCRW